MAEIWKDIEGFEGCYQVSNFGNVKRLEFIVISKTGRFIGHYEEKTCEQFKNNYGYFVVGFGKKRHNFLVSRLVAKAFIPMIEGYNTVDHIDRNKENNHVSNLRWADAKIQAHNRDDYNGGYSICLSGDHKRLKIWRFRTKRDNKEFTKRFYTKEEAQKFADDYMKQKSKI